MANKIINKLEQKADKMTFEIAKLLYGSECFICKAIGKDSRSKIIQPAHILSRQYKAIRWDALNNIVPMCGAHHGYGVHANKALSEQILHALWALVFPAKWKMINEKKTEFFDVNEINMIAKIGELELIKRKLNKNTNILEEVLND